MSKIQTILIPNCLMIELDMDGGEAQRHSFPCTQGNANHFKHASKSLPIKIKIITLNE